MAIPSNSRNETPSISVRRRRSGTGFFMGGATIPIPMRARQAGGLSKIRDRVLQVHFLDPAVAIAHVVPLALELQALRRVGNPFSAVVATIDTGIRAAPHLLNGDIGV